MVTEVLPLPTTCAVTVVVEVHSVEVVGVVFTLGGGGVGTTGGGGVGTTGGGGVGTTGGAAA